MRKQCSCYRIARRPERVTAFTLIEVLVVVAIIALLISILIPSLVKAKEQASGAVCGSDMHQLGVAQNTYVAEGKMLPANFDVLWTSRSESGGTGLPNPDWAGTAAFRSWKPSDSWLGLPWPIRQFNNPAVAGDQELLWSWVEDNAPRRGSLYRYVRNDKLYLCPKDSKGTPDPENPKGGGGNGRFSYTMLGLLGCQPPEATGSFTFVADFEQKGGAYPAGPIIKKGTRVGWTPARMPLLIEEHPWNNTNHGWVGDSWAADSYLAFRHHTDRNGGMAMFAYVDGHVQGKRYEYFVKGSFNQVNKIQGVDILNEFKVPYSYAGNAGGPENVSAFVRHFRYPYQ